MAAVFEKPSVMQRLAPMLHGFDGPLAFAVFWLLRPYHALSWRDAIFTALWPTAYSAYSLTRGAFDGFYPYFFMNPATMPHPQPPAPR